MNFSVFHEIFACFQLYIGESLTNINSRETTRQQNACGWYPKHARHSRKELGVMKQPCGARRTPPDSLPIPLKPDFQDFGRGVTRIHGFWTIKKNAPTCISLRSCFAFILAVSTYAASPFLQNHTVIIVLSTEELKSILYADHVRISKMPWLCHPSSHPGRFLL